MDIAKSQRKAYDAVVENFDGPFISKRPAFFSAAAAAQEAVNPKGTFGRFASMMLPLEYTGWVQESRAHVESCYIGDWSPLAKVTIKGPEAHAFLSWLGSNNLSKFEIGQVKHHVQLDEHGFVASEGVVSRLGEQDFFYTAGSTEWLRWQFAQGSWDATVTDVDPDLFIFGVQGPNSLFVLEKVTGDDFRDLKFNNTRESRIGEVDVRVFRTGISGELGYEIHGSADDANTVWDAVVEAGEEFSILRLGLRAQGVQHIEAGIATNGLDYLPAAAATPGAPKLFRRDGMGGSFVPSAFTDYFRKPSELGWGRKFPDTDFLGRDALVADAASGGTARTLTGLMWNHDDAVDVFASLLRDGDLVDQMELPRERGPSIDRVLLGGEDVGVSSGRTVSSNVRAMISLGVIDREHIAVGNEVVVVWGAQGTDQKEIRATITDLPFKPDNRRTDVTKL